MKMQFLRSEDLSIWFVSLNLIPHHNLYYLKETKDGGYLKILFVGCWVVSGHPILFNVVPTFMFDALLFLVSVGSSTAYFLMILLHIVKVP